MQTKPKSNAVITHEVAENVITFHVKQAGTVVFNLDAVSPANRKRAAIHGFIQRVSDGAAMSRNPETGQPAAPIDKMARMQAIVDHYQSGSPNWSMRRENRVGAEGGLLFRALMRLYPTKTPDELKAFITGLTDEQKKGLMYDPKSSVKAAIDTIHAEAISNIDAEEILAKL